MTSRLNIKWKFIVERAAWWGGFWERMAKIALKASLGKSSVSYDVLQTILIEGEATVNSPPLTYIDNDPKNIILTPGNFLLSCNNTSLGIDIDKKAVSAKKILHLWQKGENLLKRFWEICLRIIFSS